MGRLSLCIALLALPIACQAQTPGAFVQGTTISASAVNSELATKLDASQAAAIAGKANQTDLAAEISRATSAEALAAPASALTTMNAAVGLKANQSDLTSEIARAQAAEASKATAAALATTNAQVNSNTTNLSTVLGELAGTLPMNSFTAASGHITTGLYTNTSLYGSGNSAAGFSVIANNTTASAQAAVIGGGTYNANVRAGYGGLDQVAIYGENNAGPPPVEQLTGVSFTATTATLPTAMTAAQMALLKPGMIVETTNRFRAQLVSWTSTVLTVDYWTSLGSNPIITGVPSAYGGATATSLGLEVGATDQIWGLNVNLTLQPGMWTKPTSSIDATAHEASMIGDEYSLNNNAVPFVRNEFDPFNDFPRAWGVFMGSDGTYSSGSGHVALGSYDKGFTNLNGSGAYAGFLGASTAAVPLIAEFASQINSGNLIASHPANRSGVNTYAVEASSGTITRGLSGGHQTVQTTVWFAAPTTSSYPMLRDGGAVAGAGNVMAVLPFNASALVSGDVLCRLLQTNDVASWSVRGKFKTGATAASGGAIGTPVITADPSNTSGLSAEAIGLNFDGANNSPQVYQSGVANAACTASLTITTS